MTSISLELPDKNAGPPPYRWVRRASVFSGVLLGVLVILWLWWAHVAHARLQARIDAILARHEPLYPSDFFPTALPDDQNAANYYRAAIAAKAPNVDSPGSSNFHFNNYPPYPPVWFQLADGAVVANPRTLALVRQARKFDRAQWVVNPSNPVIATPLSHLNPSRDLANLVADAGLDAHLHRDDAEAIERIRDVLHQARALNDVTLVTRLTSLGIQSLAMDRLETITSDDLQIETGNSPGASRNAASRQTVIELIGELCDEETPRHWRRNALLGERMTQFDMTMWYANHATLLRPMFQLEAVRCLENGEYNLHASEQPDWRAAKAVLAAPPLLQTVAPFSATPRPDAPRFSRILTSVLLGSVDRYIEVEFRMTAERRVAAVMLATRLYRTDHGHWPTNLDELVPRYLPHVPLDPFMSVDTRIGYVVLPKGLPDGRDRPMVYFEPSGQGTTSLPAGNPIFGWQSVRSRQWRDLTTWAPTTMPTDAAPQ
jgi:hypothetical protein